MQNLFGSFVALVTPFNENGSIDEVALAKLLAWHEAEGMDGAVVAGTNGEGPSLSATEKRDLARLSMEFKGRLKIILGLGTCSITEAIWLEAQSVKIGVDACLVLPPFYFKATDEGLLKWFNQLIDNAQTPLIIYNFPQTTGISISPEIIKNLFEHDIVIGIKDSSGDKQTLDSYLTVASQFKKSVFVGDERLLLQSLKQGGSGTISGLANSFPKLISRQCKEKSDVLQNLIDEAVANIKIHPQPAVHKWVLKQKGIDVGEVRPPLVSLSEEQKNKVLTFLENFHF